SGDGELILAARRAERDRLAPVPLDECESISRFAGARQTYAKIGRSFPYTKRKLGHAARPGIRPVVPIPAPTGIVAVPPCRERRPGDIDRLADRRFRPVGLYQRLAARGVAGVARRGEPGAHRTEPRLRPAKAGTRSRSALGGLLLPDERRGGR